MSVRYHFHPFPTPSLVFPEQPLTSKRGGFHDRPACLLQQPTPVSLSLSSTRKRDLLPSPLFHGPKQGNQASKQNHKRMESRSNRYCCLSLRLRQRSSTVAQNQTIWLGCG